MNAALRLSAADLARLGVADLPISKFGVHRRAKREGWAFDEADNGTRLYDVASLPPQVRNAIEARASGLAQAFVRDGEKCGARGRPTGSNFFARNPQVADAVLACLASGDEAATTVMARLETWFDVLPDLRTLQRYIARVRHEKRAMLALTNDPEGYRSKYQLAMGRMDGDVLYAHQDWELDTTKADLMMAGNTRKMILGLIDRYSRRACYLVADSEHNQSVRAILLKAIMLWGVIPDRIVVDNGAAYISETIQSACALLGVEVKICPPGSPEKKPFVERAFGTFTRERAVLLPGFVGHNVFMAQKLRARKRKETGKPIIFGEVEPQALQAVLDNWVTGVYETRVHSGIHQSPLVRAMASPAGARPAPAVDILKQALTAYVGNLTVGKRGLRWKNGRYMSGALVAYVGQTVHVRRDEDDAGALIVFDTAGHFIGEAVNHERSGFSERDFAMHLRNAQRTLEREHKAEIRELKTTFNMDEAARQILRNDAAQAGKLAVLPIRQPANDAAEPATLAEPATITPLPVRPAGDAEIAARAAQAQDLIAASERDEPVDLVRLEWAHAFIASPRYRAWQASTALAERFHQGEQG